MNRDLFIAFLEKDDLSRDDEAWRTRALTAKSYKNVVHGLSDIETGEELATYGDALLKFVLCEYLLDDDDPKALSETKKQYESDRVLVDKLARHYDLLRYIRFDREDPHIPKNYDYEDARHKYIATALEALLGAHYKIYGDLDTVRAIVRIWMSIIDRE